MKVLVTGGAGFIGSNLVRALVAAGDEVTVLDDFSTGFLANLDDVNGGTNVIGGDLRDPTAVRNAAIGAEVIFHLGALPSVARSVEDPQASHDVNVVGTMNVLMAARDLGVRRVVYASSSSVYGDTPVLPKHEDMPPQPRSPYAAFKLAGELYCRAFPNVFDVETVSLRFFNVFGPRQDPASHYAAVIPKWATDMLEGRPPVVFGDGRQTRDFTYVSNAVSACLLAATAGPEAVGQAMNIGCGERISLLDLVGALKGIIGTNIEPVFAPPRVGDVRDSLASIDRAEYLIGYRPLVSVLDGLRLTVEWLAERRKNTSEGAWAAPAPSLASFHRRIGA
jgi:UDP-glucose 4-epimerase